MQQEVPAPLPFAEVYRLYADRVYRFTLAMVREPALAEDLTGDVFVAAMRAYDATGPDPEHLHLWLFRIAKNMVLSHRRRGRRLQRILEVLGRTPERHVTVEEQAELNEGIERVVATMDQLRPRDRLLISMRVAGLSYAEIGTLMGLTEKASNMAASRAFARLREEASHGA